MKILDQEKMERIKALLKTHPRGLSITQLSSNTGLNRNLIAKYLDMLVISGQVEIQQYGPAKVYFLSQRIPITAMIEITSDLVMVLDHDRKIVQANKPLLQFLGIPREDLIGKTPQEAGHPFLSSIPLPDPSAPVDTDSRLISEVRDPIDGRECYFRIKRAPAVFEDGSVGLTLIMENITEERRYQESIRLSEARYRGIVEDQTDFITRFLPDTTLTFANHAAARYLNCSPEELLGKRFVEFIPTEERDGVLGSIRALSRENPAVTLEHRITDARGQLRWQHWTNRAIFDENGTLKEYQGMGRDITDQKETADKISRYILQLEFISRKSLEFVHAAPDHDLYLIIARGVQSLYPDAMVCVHSYERKTDCMKLEVMLDEEARNRIQGILGRNPIGNLIHLTAEVRSMDMDGMIHRLPGAEYIHCFLDTVPEEARPRATEAMEAADVYLMGLTHQKELYGDVLLIFHEKTQLQHQHLLETYLNQASVAVQRRVFQEELLKSQAQYYRIVETSDEGIWVTDQDYRTTFVNRRLAEMFGYMPMEMWGRRVEEFMVGEDIPAHRMRVAERHAGVSGRFEQRFRRKNGSLIWTAASATPLMEDGRFTGAFAMITDITEQKRTEERLKETLALQEAILSASPVGIGLVTDHLLTWANDAMYRIQGIRPGDLKGQPESVVFADQAEYERVSQKLYQGLDQQGFGETETVLQRKDRSLVNVSLHAAPIRPGSPEIIVVATDITERKKAEEELRRTQMLQEAILSASPVGIGLLNNHAIRWGNNGMLRILGFGRGDLKDQPESVVFVDNEEYERASRELYQRIEQQGFGEIETVWKRKDGSRMDVFLRAAPIQAGSPDIIAVATDISEQKKAERKIHESEETFRTMVRINPLPLSLIDGTGKYLYLNPAFTLLFGYTLEDIPDGKTWFARAFPDEKTREAAIRFWKADAADHPEGEVRPRTFRVRCKDGSFKEILFLPASTPGGLQVVVYQDLTGEKIHQS